MMAQKLIAPLLIILIVLLSGCPAPPVVQKEPVPAPPVGKKPPAPELNFVFGSIDLAGFRGRVEQTDITQLARTVQQEKIDILSVEGIIRYPGVATRTDFVDRFAEAAGMRTAFGETATLNSRQGGNAVFSVFPIRTSENTHYTEMQGLGFEAAMQAVIDCGLRDVVIVSTHLPEKPTVDQETSAMETFSAFTSSYANHPLIISGNLPHTGVMEPPAAYMSLPVKQTDIPALWHTRDSSLTVMRWKTEKTVFGQLLIVQFGLHRAKGQ
jgi:hypothetical protein